MAWHVTTEGTWRSVSRVTGSTPPPPQGDLAGVLHDVSNALTVLLGWIDEARSPGAPPETVAYALTIVEQRAKLARDLARRAIGAKENEEPRAVQAVVDEVLRALRLEASRRKVTLRTGSAGAGGDVVVAGVVDLGQIVTNLVLNAVAHAPEGSVVDVELGVEPGQVLVVVRDEGPGVAKERRDSIFQGDTRRPGGSGVGLRHSRALARACGGDLTLAPSTVETGSGAGGAEFRVRWPRFGAPAVPTAAPSRPPLPASRDRDLSGMRVVVVEDDAAVTQLLEASLEARGADVTVARTDAELTARIKDAGAAFDAALIDLSPIARDPAAALASLRAHSPAVAVVLVTGNADHLPESVASAVEIVRKPFEVREVVAVLSAARSKRA